MRNQPWKLLGVGLLLLSTVTLSGCQGTRSRKGMVAAEPALSVDGETVVDAAPPKSMTWVDRHPLFSQPREYYQSTNRNVVVKTAAATVIGIPAGFIGEVKQIVVGQDPH